MVDRIHIVNNSPVYYERKEQHGGDTPAHLRSIGKYLNNEYTLAKNGYRRSYSKLVYVKYPNVVVPPGTLFSTNSYYTVTVSASAAPSESNILAKLAGKWRQTDLNVGMYASPEGRESLSMIANSLMKLSNSARQLKRGDFGGFLRNLNELPRSARRASARKFNQGDLSGSFLAAHLGWEPLIKDIYTASGDLSLDETTHRITARGLGSIRTFSVGTSGNPIPSARQLQKDQKNQVRLILDVTRQPTFSQRFGMDNPFLIAWELVPLSFVADYFLPIGSVIDNMGFISGIWGQRGWRKTYDHYVYKTWIAPRTTLGRASNGELYCNQSEMTTWFYQTNASRKHWAPSFSDPFRSIKTDLPASVMKLSTLAALTHQRILALGRR